MSPEAKVGLFVLIGISVLVYMSLRVGGISLGRQEGYVLNVKLVSAAGLDKGASVRVAGVEVGQVEEIVLKDNRAYITLRIRPDTIIGSDFTAVLTTKGLLGERYIELIPGSPNAPPLKEGDEITRVTTYADMDVLITALSDVSADMKKVSRALGNVLGGPEGETTIRRIVTNVEELTVSVNRLVRNNDQKLNNIIANLDEFTTLLRKDGPDISTGLKEAIANLNRGLVQTSDNLNQLIEENRGGLKEGVENLRVASLKLQEAMDTLNKVTQEIGPRINSTVDSVNSIAEKIDRGEGTIGKLVNDESMHENINKTVTGINKFIEKAESLHTYVGYRGEYLFDVDETKSYLSLRIQPKSDKYYLLEVIDDPRGRRETETRTTTVGGATTVTREVKTADEFKFSLQMAKKIRGVTLRGGLIESTGGVGVDVELFRERLKFSLEAFDFTAGEKPHMKAGATLYFYKFFFLTAGADDFLSDDGLESAYLGLGLQFRDDDLKYLFTAAPPISVQ